jgi:hypothetical protein
MSSSIDTSLSWLDRALLRMMAYIVPALERADWLRTWHAELWHMRHQRRRHQASLVVDLSIGLVRDALWLRTESWRRTFVGTATLCIASLAALSTVSLLVGLALAGNRQVLGTGLKQDLGRSGVAAGLVVFVAFATASRRHAANSSKIKWLGRINRQLFFAWKIVQVLLLAFLLSFDLSLPLRNPLPNTSDFFQMLDFVLLAVVGLRWALRDQELRCKQCLQALTMPSRVGRPSHNLLEWNGSEMNCKHGHGLLSVPEMETSWCEAARWIERGDPC